MINNVSIVWTPVRSNWNKYWHLIETFITQLFCKMTQTNSRNIQTDSNKFIDPGFWKNVWYRIVFNTSHQENLGTTNVFTKTKFILAYIHSFLLWVPLLLSTTSVCLYSAYHRSETQIRRKTTWYLVIKNRHKNVYVIDHKDFEE